VGFDIYYKQKWNKGTKAVPKYSSLWALLSGYAVVVSGSALPELDSLPINALTDDVAI